MSDEKERCRIFKTKLSVWFGMGDLIKLCNIFSLQFFDDIYPSFSGGLPMATLQRASPSRIPREGEGDRPKEKQKNIVALYAAVEGL